MAIYLTVTPADASFVYQIIETQNDLLQEAMLRAMRWHAVLLEQDEDAFTFGAPATVIADLGEVPADREYFHNGDPVWGDLLSRIEVAGYDPDQDLFHNELIPFGLWMRCTYLAPQSGRTIDDLWDGQMVEI